VCYKLTAYLQYSEANLQRAVIDYVVSTPSQKSRKSSLVVLAGAIQGVLGRRTMTANNEGGGNRSPWYASDYSPISTKVSMHCRRKIFSVFMESMKPTQDMVVLDLGVTSDEIHEESNFFEQWYPYGNMLVCAGVESGNYLEKKYPGVRFVQIVPNGKLPFNDREFDIVFSNAATNTLEHNGTSVFSSGRFFEYPRAFS